jgi:hypothetical protein
MPDRVRPMGDSLALAVTSPSITLPLSLWLGLPWRFRSCEARHSRS